MKKKVVKNEEAPQGRNDWKGRTPRWRPTWFLSKFLIIKEIMEDYFTRHPETRNSQEYSGLYDEVCNIIQQMQTPLMGTTEEFPLLDEQITWD